MTFHFPTLKPLPTVLLLGLLLTLPALAQEGNLFFDTVDVAVVNLEVLVNDAEGLPVTDLREEDFEILVDGNPVDITNFFMVRNREATLVEDEAPDPGMAGVTPTPETTRLNLVVFVDDLNMRPENRNLIFRRLRSFLTEKLDPRDRVMLVSQNDRVRVTEGFTNDTQALLAALDEMEKVASRHLQTETEMRRVLRRLQGANLTQQGGGLDSTNFLEATLTAEQLAQSIRVLIDQRYQKVAASVDSLKRFTASLAGMEGRKAVLYVSDGLPTQPGESLAQAWINKYESWIYSEDAQDVLDELRDMGRISTSRQFDASRILRELVEEASANRVAFYPISNGSRIWGAAASAEYGGSGTSDGRGAFSQDVAALENINLDRSLLQMAEGTGGVAFTRSTNIDGLMERMVQDYSSFYSLGYTPEGGGDDAFHKVQIKVNRPDVEVRHFKGVRKKEALANLQDLTLSALHYGLVDNTLEIELEPGEITPAEAKGRFRQTVLVKIAFGKLLLLPEEENQTGRVTLFVTVRDEKTGGLSPFQRIELPIKIPNANILEALGQTAAYPLELELEGGTKRLAIGARDHLSRTDATVDLVLELGS